MFNDTLPPLTPPDDSPLKEIPQSQLRSTLLSVPSAVLKGSTVATLFPELGKKTLCPLELVVTPLNEKGKLKVCDTEAVVAAWAEWLIAPKTSATTVLVFMILRCLDSGFKRPAQSVATR